MQARLGPFPEPITRHIYNRALEIAERTWDSKAFTLINGVIKFQEKQRRPISAATPIAEAPDDDLAVPLDSVDILSVSELPEIEGARE